MCVCARVGWGSHERICQARRQNSSLPFVRLFATYTISTGLSCNSQVRCLCVPSPQCGGDPIFLLSPLPPFCPSLRCPSPPPPPPSPPLWRPQRRPLSNHLNFCKNHTFTRADSCKWLLLLPLQRNIVTHFARARDEDKDDDEEPRRE